MSWIYTPGGGGTPNPAAGPADSIQLSNGSSANTYSAGFSYTGTTLQGSGLAMTVTPLAPGTSDAGTMTVSGRAATTATKAGGALALAGGAGSTTGAGGAVTINGGANASSGAAGSITLTAGTSSSGAAGAITIRAGDRATGGNGGAILVRGGDSTQLANNGGAVVVQGGTGTLDGGNVTVAGGFSSVGGVGGKVTLQGGLAADFTGQSVIIKTGLFATATIEVNDDAVNKQIGFYGTAPIAKPTTAVAAAAFVANAGTAVNDASTFGGYTLGKLVTALKSLGLLA
jgi:hypothetical protein